MECIKTTKLCPSPPRAAALCRQEQLERNARLADRGALVRRDPLVIDDDQCFPIEQFLVPHHYKDSVKEILIPHGLVQDRCGAGSFTIG